MSRKSSKSRDNSAAAERLADWRGGENSFVPQGHLSLADADSPDYDNRSFPQEPFDEMDGSMEEMSLRDVEREKVCYKFSMIIV